MAQSPLTCATEVITLKFWKIPSLRYSCCRSMLKHGSVNNKDQIGKKSSKFLSVSGVNCECLLSYVLEHVKQLGYEERELFRHIDPIVNTVLGEILVNIDQLFTASLVWVHIAWWRKWKIMQCDCMEFLVLTGWMCGYVFVREGSDLITLMFSLWNFSLPERSLTEVCRDNSVKCSYSSGALFIHW